ncbi:kinase-like protein [Aspergillus sclerotioniger CBS 115572]|uniref:EKC/KEOPS complex subunit BUD32 n=1 Tax=Aspergillus sclerotioniger CBS 115572 TaxID=1450535 RepID=A0A317WKF7_9EURO|nr:kinase-like protein [Aspergillus sclerotioniger CBS 115572]PWY86545.1 kinase-like protein [Aspergillus sclerotioniger CBS 115572]
MTLITQGAEAHLYKTTFLTPHHPAALKIRPSKPYRHPILDRRLTRQRVLQEARCLARLVREGVNVPAVLGVDWDVNSSSNISYTGDGNGEGNKGAGVGAAWLLMEWIPGDVIRVVIQKWEGVLNRTQGEDAEAGEEKEVGDLLRRVGGAVGALHKAGVVHGDLTTSNLILRPKGASLEEIGGKGEGEGGKPNMDGDIVLIDFGLASQSIQDEDRAVDLYVLERAFGSTHPRTEPLFGEVLEGYRGSYRGAGSVLKRLEDVRMRGRKRSMLG